MKLSARGRTASVYTGSMVRMLGASVSVGLLSLAMFAQGNAGRILGAVTDQTGSAIVGIAPIFRIATPPVPVRRSGGSAGGRSRKTREKNAFTGKTVFAQEISRSESAVSGPTLSSSAISCAAADSIATLSSSAARLVSITRKHPGQYRSPTKRVVPQ